MILNACEPSETAVARAIVSALLVDATALACGEKGKIRQLLPSASTDVFVVFYAAFMTACGQDARIPDRERGWYERMASRALNALQGADGMIHPPISTVFAHWWSSAGEREKGVCGGVFLDLWKRAEWWCAVEHQCVHGHQGWIMGRDRRACLKATVVAGKSILSPSIKCLCAMGIAFGKASTALFAPAK